MAVRSQQSPPIHPLNDGVLRGYGRPPQSSVTPTILSVSASGTDTAGTFVLVNAAGGNVTRTLPAGALPGQSVTYKRTDANAPVSWVFIAPTWGAQIDQGGANNAYALALKNECVSLTFDGTNWQTGPQAPYSRLLAPGIQYAPTSGSNVTYVSGSTTVADLDAVNLALTFVAPPSASVLFRMRALALVNTLAETYGWTLRQGANEVTGARQYATGQTNGIPPVYESFISKDGSAAALVPGTTYTFKWAHIMGAGNHGATVFIGGAAPTYFPAVMEVWG